MVGFVSVVVFYWVDDFSYTVDINPPSDIYFVNIFPNFVVCLFALLSPPLYIKLYIKNIVWYYPICGLLCFVTGGVILRCFLLLLLMMLFTFVSQDLEFLPENFSPTP